MEENLSGKIYSSQISQSEAFRNAFASLEASQTRKIEYNGFSYTLQLNPARIKSSTASIARPASQESCFLCSRNMPAGQIKAPYDSEFFISVNPYPILRRHLTIISRIHTPQTIHGHAGTLLRLAQEMPGMAAFYNSPKSGASAPFHCHLQAGMAGALPVFSEFESIRSLYSEKKSGGAWIVCGPTRRMILTEHSSMQAALDTVSCILAQLCAITGCSEPEANIGAMLAGGKLRTAIFPRQKHRPSEYFAQGSQQILVSPGFADMAGLIPCSRPEDFEKITKENITSIMNQVSMPAGEIRKIKI